MADVMEVSLMADVMEVGLMADVMEAARMGDMMKEELMMADLLYVCEKAALQSHYQWTLLCNAEEQR